MDSYQYAKAANEIAERTGSSKVFSQKDLDLFQSGENPVTHPNTDWFDETLKDIAPQQRQNLTISSGSENIKYFISGEYLNQKSHFPTDEFESNRYNLRSNLDTKVTDFLNLGADLAFRLHDEYMPHNRGEGGSQLAITGRLVRSLPIDAAFWPNGLPAYGGELGQNPALMATDLAGFEDTKSFSVRTKFSFDLDLKFLTKGLSLDGYFSYDRNNFKRKELKIPFTVYQYQDGEFIEAIGNGGNENTQLWDRSSEWANQLYHIKLNYRNSFGNHNINAFLAYEQQERQSSNIGGYRKNIFSELLPELDLGYDDGREVSGSSGESGKVNYFGSISYNYMGKYLLDFTLRRDGSFNFPENSRFGIFPGISAGWNITEESFYPEKSFIDNLKLRASWATMGNDNIPQFQYLTAYTLASFYIFGDNRDKYDGLSEHSLPNPNITWETSKTANVGFDLFMFDNKFRFQFDYFNENRTNILRRRNAAIPDFAALSLPDENFGEVQNRGVEFLLGYANNMGNFNYNLGGQFTFNRNKVINMAEAEGVLEWQKQEGHPIDSWLVYKLEGNGVVNTEEELENYPHRSGTQLGDLHLLDYNDDGFVNEDDRVRVYSSPRPEIQYSFNNDFEYKGFELNLLWQGQARAKTMLHFVDDTGNRPAYLFERRWTPENPDSDYPAPYSSANRFYNALSEYHLHNAAFLRLKNAEVAYNFSNLPGLHGLFKRLRFYVSATNLWTLVPGDMKYYDPEIDQDQTKYFPQLSSVSAGLNITIN
jgi:TonB-dependent starch-binding outer membrane protein SusC